MNKAIIFLALLIILSSFVSATIYDNDIRLRNLFKFEEASGNFLDTADAQQCLIPLDGGIKHQTPSISPVGSYAVNLTGTSWMWGNDTVKESFMPSPLTVNVTFGCWFNFYSDIPDTATPMRNYAYKSGSGFGWTIGLHPVNLYANQITYRSASQLTEAQFGFLYTLNTTMVLGGWYDGAQFCALINDTLVDCTSHNTGLTNGNYPFTIASEYNTSAEAMNFTVDDCFFFNQSLTQSELTDIWTNGIQPPDTTPPTLSNINCTSCNFPYGDTAEPYETEDTTPTFKFNTNENAWCAIGVSDVNYTAMGSSRNCTSGEGTTSHTCTLTVQDKFTNPGTNYLYISCKDSIGNEGNASNTSKSNSGPIEVDTLIETTTITYLYGVDGLTAKIIDDEKFVYVKDLQGNIVKVLNESKNVVWNQSYDIFGVPLNDHGNETFGYRSSMRDKVTGNLIGSWWLNPLFMALLSSVCPDCKDVYCKPSAGTNMIHCCQYIGDGHELGGNCEFGEFDQPYYIPDEDKWVDLCDALYFWRKYGGEEVSAEEVKEICEGIHGIISYGPPITTSTRFWHKEGDPPGLDYKRQFKFPESEGDSCCICSSSRCTSGWCS